MLVELTRPFDSDLTVTGEKASGASSD
ncbi:MAG: hypothetical protein QOI57_1350, partial [Rubrobacteraceae bacterium]|nr:hypothetical protein [Rubrobacteraceae bacterium]